jgi:AcrR family transcriptional regulator
MAEELIVPRTPNRRDTLLAAALDGFAARGYEATTVAELAAATGMSKAAVSYHFRTKDDLLHALAEPLLDRLDALIARHRRTPEQPNQLRSLLSEYLQTLTDCHQVAAWIDTDKAVLNHSQIGARLHRNTQRMCRNLTDATRPDTAATARAMAVLGTLWRPLRTLTPAQLTTHHDALIDTATAALQHRTTTATADRQQPSSVRRSARSSPASTPETDPAR